MSAVGFVFFGLSCFICVTNIVNGVLRMIRKRRGETPRRGSNIHVLSIVFAIMAYVFAKDTLGAWVFIPAVIDPATLFIFAAPVLLFRMRKANGQGHDHP